METQHKGKDRSKKKVFRIAGALFLFLSVLVFLYPFMSSYINKMYDKGMIEAYESAVDDKEENEKKELLNKARIYNGTLVTAVRDPDLSADEKVRYEDVLSLTQTGQIGVIKIPKINVELPVFHEGDDNLSKGATHMKGTSFPVGGSDIHCVISAHTAYPGKIFFDDLTKLENDDYFYISILDHTYAYKVINRVKVLPEDTDRLDIEKNKDLCTLITCTPYAVNTHRLLITGERDEAQEQRLEKERESTDSREDSNNSHERSDHMDLPLIIMIVLLSLFITMIVLIFIPVFKSDKTDKKTDDLDQRYEKVMRKKRDNYSSYFEDSDEKDLSEKEDL